MKILTIHATAGAGHQRAAQALYEGIKKYTAHQVSCVDALDHTSPFFKKMYRGVYFFFIAKVPWFWGAIFALLDLSWVQPIVVPLRRVYNAVNASGLERFLVQENFDYIFSTHFMSTEVVSALKKSNKIKSKLITVVTDFDVHRIWLAPYVDHYAVASTWTKSKLIELQVKEEKIAVTGIPIDERFTLQPDIGTLKRNFGLQENVFTVLMATGSFGIGPIEELIEELKDFQLMVVCGHNKDLYERLSQINNPLLKVFGLVNNMQDLMACADVFLTKPGGLSMAEGLVSHLPLIFFNAIPGQETHNMMVLNEYGIGTKTGSIKEIKEACQKYKDSRDLFLTAVRKTKELARPQAVRDIIGLIR